jgi:hypothetical protein
MQTVALLYAVSSKLQNQTHLVGYVDHFPVNRLQQELFHTWNLRIKDNACQRIRTSLVHA